MPKLSGYWSLLGLWYNCFKNIFQEQRIVFEITQDITGISVGLWYVHVTGDRVAGSVPGQPCLTTGGGRGCPPPSRRECASSYTHHTVIVTLLSLLSGSLTARHRLVQLGNINQSQHSISQTQWVILQLTR